MITDRLTKLTVVATAVLSATAIAACGSNQNGPSQNGSSQNGSSQNGSSQNGSTTGKTSASSDGSPSGGGGTPAVKAASPSTAKLSSFTLRVGDQAADGAEALLKAAGLLNTLPFKVDWADFTSGPPMLQAVEAGSVDLGQVGDTPPVFAAAGGAKIAVISALRGNPLAAALIVPHNSPITSIKDLKGKSIAVAQGSSADYHLLTVLKAAGLTTHDITIDYLQPAEAQAALQSGRVDAWDTWAPYIQEVVATDHDRVLVTGNGYGSNYSYEVAARPALSNPTAVAAIKIYMKTVDRAHAWADSHPEAWAKLWAAGTGLPYGVMLKAAEQDTLVPVPVDSAIVAEEQKLVEAFSSTGLIPHSYDFAQYASASFNGSL